VTLEKNWNPLSAELRPGPRWESSRRSPNPIVGHYLPLLPLRRLGSAPLAPRTPFSNQPSPPAIIRVWHYSGDVRNVYITLWQINAAYYTPNSIRIVRVLYENILAYIFSWTRCKFTCNYLLLTTVTKQMTSASIEIQLHRLCFLHQ